MGIFFAVLTAAVWALYNLVVRRGRELMDPGAGYLLTLVVNVAAYLAFLLLPLPGAGLAELERLPVLFFGLAGLSTTLLGRWIYFESVYTLGPSRASSWKNAAPVYTLVLGALFLGEAVTWFSAVGVAITLAGMWWLGREQEAGLRQAAEAPGAGGGGRAAGNEARAAGNEARAAGAVRDPRAGLLLGAASGLAFSCGILFRRAGLLIWPAPAWGGAIGAVAALTAWLPFAIAKGEAARLLAARGPGLYLWLAAGLLSSLAQLFSFLALRTVPSAIVQVVTSLEPVFTMGLSLLLLGGQENLNRRLMVAVTAICLGVTVAVL